MEIACPIMYKKDKTYILDKWTKMFFQSECCFQGIVKHNFNRRLWHLKVASMITLAFLTRANQNEIKTVCGFEFKNIKRLVNCK